jgi:hypothetical protein
MHEQPAVPLSQWSAVTSECLLLQVWSSSEYWEDGAGDVEDDAADDTDVDRA